MQQQDGDKLDIFIMTSGEYRFGYIDSNSKLWVSTSNIIHFDTAYAEDTQITVDVYKSTSRHTKN